MATVRTSLIAFLIAGALLVWADPGAAETVPLSSALAGGPSLAGPSVYWAQRGPGDTVRVLQGRAGRSRTVGEYGPRFAATSVEVGISSSPRLVSLNLGSSSLDAEGQPEGRGIFSVLIGPVGGAPTPFGPPCKIDEVSSSAVGDATEVIYQDCRGQPSVADFSTGSPQHARALPKAGARDYAVPAGRYVPFREPIGSTYRVGVYDWIADRDLYTVDTGRTGVGVVGQADGKLAVTYSITVKGQPRQRVGWTSPSEPSLHPLRSPGGNGFEVRVANDVIAFAAPEEGSGLLRVGTLSLAGRRHTLTKRSFGGFDFDGRRLAWEETSCGKERIRIAPVDAKRVGYPTCRLRLRGSARTTSRSVRFRVRCPDGSRYCLVATAVLRTDKAYRVRGRPLRKGARLTAPRVVRRGRLARLRLNRLGRALLVSHRRPRVRLTVRLPLSAKGDGDRASTRLTLKRP